MKTLNRKMWENVLERRFTFQDVEISSVNKTQKGDYYGEFMTFSQLIEGVESTHYYFCDNTHIVTFRTERELFVFLLNLYNVI